MWFVCPEGEKKEAKLSQLELLAQGEEGVWLSLKGAQGGTMSPPGCGGSVGSVPTARCL